MVACGEPPVACQHGGMSQAHQEPLGSLLYRVMAALRPQAAAELKPLGIGLAEFVCMRILAKHPGLTSAELARGTNVSAQAANQVLRSLEERGALARPVSAPAGRAMPARLTREGKALLKRADAAVRVADQRILARLSADDQVHLKRLLYAAGSDPGR
jgi:DNA-binding MarR family transcriptional regulator